MDLEFGSLEEPTEDMTRDGAAAALEGELRPITPQFDHQRNKLSFLAEYAVKDAGCKTPGDVIALLAKLDSSGKWKAPHALMDRLYAAAQKARAYKAWKASQLPT